MMLLHASIAMNLLHKSNHTLVTLGVEVDVVASTNTLESASTVSNWIVTNGILNIVPEITNKSLTIVQLDSKRLIVNGTPCTIDCLTVALVLCRTLLCLSFEAIKKLRSVNFFFFELEIVLGRENLDFVGLLMRANLIGMEKVDSVNL